MSNSYHLVTYGCQMNKNDSERISGVFRGMGMEETKNPSESDVIVINTCSVRQSAEDRVFGNVRNFAKLKKDNPNLVIGVTGCMPGRDRDGKLKKKLSQVDLFFPIEDIIRLPEWLSSLNPTLTNTGASLEEDYLKIQPVRLVTRQAYVTIQTGCNKFCTYCVVPFSRGFERNRSVTDIINEIRGLADKGCVDVTLLGQTVNSYKSNENEFSKNNPYTDHFAALLWEVNQIPGISRIHFTAPHPLHMTDEIIDAMSLPKHLNYLHLPVQAGDNDVLRKMNRRYTREQYLELINRIKLKIPNIALGTDIIVGYCGETKEQFSKTVDLYKKCDFDISYTAMYSPRSGTVSYRAWRDDVDRKEKKRRWQTLHKLMEETVLKKNQKYVGQVVSVLADTFEKVKGEQGWVAGNSREMKRVKFPGTKDMVSGVHDIHVARSLEWVLYGKRV